MAEPTAPQTGEPTNNQANPPVTAPPATQEVKVFDAEYVKDLRTENANYRTKAKTAEDRTAELEKQIATLQGQTKQSAIRAAVAVESGKLKIVDADAAMALMDATGVAIGDDGKVTGIEDALKKLIEAKPYLVGEQSGVSTPQGNPSREDQTANSVQPGLSRLSYAYSKNK